MIIIIIILKFRPHTIIHKTLHRIIHSGKKRHRLRVSVQCCRISGLAACGSKAWKKYCYNKKNIIIIKKTHRILGLSGSRQEGVEKLHLPSKDDIRHSFLLEFGVYRKRTGKNSRSIFFLKLHLPSKDDIRYSFLVGFGMYRTRTGRTQDLSRKYLGLSHKMLQVQLQDKD